MHLLLTNDDGVHADGLQAMIATFRPLARLTVVAPDRERSAVGHSLTFHSPLRVRKLEEQESYVCYSTDGTPTDCVLLALYDLLAEDRPDLVLSGINRGSNLGDDVTYSGTVSGALEAALLGAPAVAVSLMRTRDWTFDFGPSARVAQDVAAHVLQEGLPERVFLNVNVPRGIPKGLRLTVQGKRNHVTTIAERVDPRGQTYYWIEEGRDDWDPHDRSDFLACREGYVSITPLQPDMTAHVGAPAWLGRLETA